MDASARRAIVEPGYNLTDFDAAGQAYGLATPPGINFTAGVAGLTLGGGFGLLSRKYGMTVDNLLSADVITGDARKMHASETENADLLWGLRCKAPPLPFLPEGVHGKEIVALRICCAGDATRGESLIDALRGFGTAYGEHIGGQAARVAPVAMDLLEPGR